VCLLIKLKVLPDDGTQGAPKHVGQINSFANDDYLQTQISIRKTCFFLGGGGLPPCFKLGQCNAHLCKIITNLELAE
jgi:hypothetical protein